MDTEVEKVYGDCSTIEEIINDKIASNIQERSFYVVDLCDIYKKHLCWLQCLPRVKPFYAVKCNNLPEIVKFLASLGANFDCASKQEIDQVLSCGVDASRIIYANPCKTRLFVQHARNVNVDLMTFDNELELHKVAQLHPNARLVLRIKGEDRNSRCKLNIKFGADLGRCYGLLKLAKQLDLNVMGVSFHNGSDCGDKDAYWRSIGACRLVYDMAAELGHTMTLIDLGGGFPGENGGRALFEDMALVINRALDTYFPPSTGVEFIAEPGRYYVASALTLCTMVIAKRFDYNDKLDKDGFMYYLNDGVYGAFSAVLTEDKSPMPRLLHERKQIKRRMLPCTLWGPTCDSIDCVKRDFEFPELEVGEWIVFENMGAYSNSVATKFNGFDLATVIIVDNIYMDNTIR